MIRDCGNCGHTSKADRILRAIESAKKNECGITILLDKLIYSNNARIIKHNVLNEYSFAFGKDTLYLIRNDEIESCIPWWDVVAVQVIW